MSFLLLGVAAVGVGMSFIKDDEFLRQLGHWMIMTGLLLGSAQAMLDFTFGAINTPYFLLMCALFIFFLFTRLIVIFEEAAKRIRARR